MTIATYAGGTAESGELLDMIMIAAGDYRNAFDQRGNSPGARPRAHRRYALDLVAGDVTSVSDSLGIERFHLSGSSPWWRRRLPCSHSYILAERAS